MKQLRPPLGHGAHPSPRALKQDVRAPLLPCSRSSGTSVSAIGGGRRLKASRNTTRQRPQTSPDSMTPRCVCRPGRARWIAHGERGLRGRNFASASARSLLGSYARFTWFRSTTGAARTPRREPLPLCIDVMRSCCRCTCQGAAQLARRHAKRDVQILFGTKQKYLELESPWQ